MLATIIKVEGSEDKLLANIKYYTLKYSNTKRFQQVKEKKKRKMGGANKRMMFRFKFNHTDNYINYK